MKAMNFVLAVVTALVAVSNPLTAQEMKRTEIARHDLTGTNMEVILSVVDVPAGGSIPRHTHHGEEAFYILEGAQIQIPGKDSSSLEVGKGGINVRDVPHAGYKVIGDKALKILSVHIVDKGKDVYVPAP